MINPIISLVDFLLLYDTIFSSQACLLFNGVFSRAAPTTRWFIGLQFEKKGKVITSIHYYFLLKLSVHDQEKKLWELLK